MSTDNVNTAINDVRVLNYNENNPCIYVANLGAYNSGRMVGKWLDLTTFKTVEELKEAVDRIANYLGSIYGDEWAIHDYSNFPNLGENPDLEFLFELKEVLVDHYAKDALEAFLEYHGLQYFDDVTHLETEFEEVYDGEHTRFEEFAENLFDELYLHDVPEHIQSYIDYEKYARDLSYDYYEIDNPKGGIFVFRSC